MTTKSATTKSSADESDPPRMTGARIFVTCIFVCLGLIFLASSAIFVHEFSNASLQPLMMMHSHLFVFFSTLGLLALAAFRLPATVLTHFYWNHLKYGPLRYLLGLIAVIAGTAYFSYGLLTQPERSIWELSPSIHLADRNDPPNCGTPGASGTQAVICRRANALAAVDQLRSAATQRIGLSDFARICKPDPLMEIPETFIKERYCFPALGKLAGANCCDTQKRFSQAIDSQWTKPDSRSMSSNFDLIALPAKTFFVIVLLVIGVLLVIWRRTLDHTYPSLAPAIERSLFIGAIAMLLWPAMDYAYLTAMQTLTGRWSDQPELRLSLVIAPWALLILMYFLARMSRKIERMGQLVGAAASIVAVLRYEQLNDWAVRIVGIGAPIWSVAVLAVASLIGYAILKNGPTWASPTHHTNK
jgi:hypothetical protein